eukprot:501862_1
MSLYLVMIVTLCFMQCNLKALKCGDSNISGSTNPGNIMYYPLQIDACSVNVTIDACSSNYDTYLYFWKLDHFSNGNYIPKSLIAKNDDRCGFQSKLKIVGIGWYSTSIQGGDWIGDYEIGVGGYGNDSGSYSFNIICQIPIAKHSDGLMIFMNATLSGVNISHFSNNLGSFNNIATEVFRAPADVTINKYHMTTNTINMAVAINTVYNCRLWYEMIGNEGEEYLQSYQFLIQLRITHQYDESAIFQFSPGEITFWRISPTHDPTTSPTVAPTTAPTINPTQNTRNPTNYPTKKPTRNPTTSKEYDSYFMITYLILNLQTDDINHLTSNSSNTIHRIIQNIESAYYEVTSLQFEHYWLQVTEIIGIKTENINKDKKPEFVRSNDKIDISSTIKCDKTVCEILLDSKYQKRFLSHAQNNLRDYFSSFQNTSQSNITFLVEGDTG